MIPSPTQWQQFREHIPDTGLDLLPEPCPMASQCGWYPTSCRVSCPRFQAWKQLRIQAHWPVASYDQRWVPLGGEFPPAAMGWADDTWDSVPVTIFSGTTRGALLPMFLTLWAGVWIRRGIPPRVQTVEWPDPSGTEIVTCRIWLVPPGIFPPRVPLGADHTVILCDDPHGWSLTTADIFHQLAGGQSFTWTRIHWGQPTFQRAWQQSVPQDWPLPDLTQFVKN